MTAHIIDSLVELPNEFLSVGPDELIELHTKSKAVVAMVEQFKKSLRAHVEQTGGQLVGSNGTALKLIPSSRDRINAALAWPILSQELTLEDLAGCTEISKGKMQDAIASHAPKGQKKHAIHLIMEALRKVGAAKTTEFTQMRLVQAKNQIKELEIG
jgi:hypothetical protein